MLAAIAAPAPRIGTPGSSVAATGGVAAAGRAGTPAGGGRFRRRGRRRRTRRAGFDVDGVTELTGAPVGVTLAGGVGSPPSAPARGGRPASTGAG